MLTEQNKENRKKGIGASEAAIVMGLNPNISPYQLWLEKTGRAERPDLSDIPQVYWGTILEEVIAQEYAKRNNCKVRRMTNTLFHKDYPFILCHLDRKIEGLPKALECKFAMFARDEWGESGSDIVPQSYIVQVQHQLAVTGYEQIDLAVNIGGWDYREYQFKRDEEIIKRIIDELTVFWRHVENDTPPALRDASDAVLAYPFSNGEFVEAQPEILEAVEKFRAVNAQDKVISKEKQELKNILTLFIKDADGIRAQNEVLATWKSDKNGKRTLRVKEGRV